MDSLDLKPAIQNHLPCGRLRVRGAHFADPEIAWVQPSGRDLPSATHAATNLTYPALFPFGMPNVQDVCNSGFENVDIVILACCLECYSKWKRDFTRANVASFLHGVSKLSRSCFHRF